MRRRAALSSCFALGGGVHGLFSAAGATAPAAAGVLVWGATVSWVGRVGAALQAVPADGSSASSLVPPAPAAKGVWALASSRRLELWQRNANDDWAAVARHDFEAPVHALAASRDGRHALAAHGELSSLIDATGALVRRYEGTDLQRRRRARALRLFYLARRRSFVVAWPDLGELWEISLDPAAEPVFDGLVHDYRMGEGIAQPGYLGVRRAPLGAPMADIGFADGRLPWVAGQRGEFVDVVHLDVRRRIAEWRLPGAMPSAALARRAGDGWTWWLPVGEGVQVIDTTRWRVLDRIGAPGRVQQLQALGDAVWALCGDGASARLEVWRSGAWTRVELPTGTPRDCRADPEGLKLLVATASPSRLFVLDGDARPLHAWPLPEGSEPVGVRWLPNAG